MILAIFSLNSSFSATSASFSSSRTISELEKPAGKLENQQSVDCHSYTVEFRSEQLDSVFQ